MTPSRRATAQTPRGFVCLGAGVTVAAAVAVAVAVRSGAGAVAPLESARFWVLAVLTVGMECLPIRLPRGEADDVITVSSAFALATLFCFGPAPAIAVWTAGAVVADVTTRVRAPKVLFNAAQYALCMAAAALGYAAAGGAVPTPLTVDALPAMVAAAVVLFVVNHLVVGLGIAFMTRTRVAAVLTRDFSLLTWTTGFQLALAPLLVGAEGPLVALGAVPVLAIYLGGRQAADATHAATHDPLTGLANRALLASRLTETLDRRGASRAGWVALIDLDDFKSINDTLGHHCGDVLLRHVADRMREALREGDLLARLGGDEFAVILAGANAQDAHATAARLLELLAEPVRVGDLALQVSASVGLADCDGPGLRAEEVLQRADVALYEAKARRGSIAAFSAGAPGTARPGVDRVALGAELATALDTDQLYVHFQPKVAATGGLQPALEALVRWRHPQLGLVDPQAFVAVAEETGMIRRLTERVLDLALERCADWRTRGIVLRMCVNLSAKSLVDESLPAMVADALARHDLPGDALQFEITETACVADVPRSRAVLDALRATGATLAIDDFGTGFSSLSQLQALDVEEVKIDRSFVMAMEDDPQAAVIVRSVVNLGHSLGLRVCAEGVETAAALRSLRELGCDYVQGFYFGQPAPDASPLRALAAVAAA